ncbi:MAG TPA: hypothetical protein VL633_04575 [Bacteroidota bacterium]|nr:hypothetical protein [Bacteroidota bacterium]
MKIKIVNWLTVLTLFGILVLQADAADKRPGQPRSVSKINGSPVYTYFNINNLSTVLRNDGVADIDAQEQNSGLVFPKGSRKTAAFQTGFLWGGKVNGEIRVGGSSYRTGLQPGKIISPGNSEDPNLPKNRIYRVRRDVFPGGPTVSFASEISDEGGSADAIRAQYEKDWTEWPVADGAPFYDANGDGILTPAEGDYPGFPGADQTIWFVCNDNNSGATTQLYGATPMGIEMQVTIWGYSQQGSLGNMFFKKYLLINKGSNPIDEMYVSQWSDVDLGNSTDDYSGCDTSLSLGYTYNATADDATYDPLPPPVTGFDFFQGPVVSSPGDSAIFGGKRIYDKKNLPMTAFYYFARGDATVTDPVQGSYSEGALRFYNFFQGKIGLTGQPFTDPNTGNPTSFALAGDPVAGTGWVDGQLLPAGDRRQGSASGPFTMAVGDTQEVVVAEICAGAIPGVDHLSCISLLKYFDKSAQIAYDNFFNIPAAPPPPKVTASEYNKEIVLVWGGDAAAVQATENASSAGYTFQGYNVYQLPSVSATKDRGRRIATFDIKDGIGIIKDQVFDPLTGALVEQVAQVGTDQGISRNLDITNDVLKGGVPLVNGIRYYFAVTAYSYNPDPNAVPNNLETPLTIITVTPHQPDPGVSYQGRGGDTVAVQHTSSGNVSEGSVLPIIIDPAKNTGHTYKIVFDTAGGTFHWNVIDVTAGNVVVLANQTNQSGDANYAIIDGIQIKVLGPPPGMKDWAIPNGLRRWTFADADGNGFEGFLGAMGYDAPSHFFNGVDLTVKPDELRNTLIKLATASSSASTNPNNTSEPYGGWDENTVTDTLFSYGYRYLRSATAAPAVPAFAPYIVNATAGYPFQDYKRGVPFAAYNAETNPPTRLAVGFFENNQPFGLVDGKYWPPPNGVGVTNTQGDGPREWFFIFNTPYTGATPDPALEGNMLTDPLPVMWWGTPNRRGGADFTAGDEFLILANHPNTIADVFTFTAPGVTHDKAAAIQDVDKIVVFPNPYYAINTEELNKYQRFVTFSHLPERATLRIFNLAGVLVRTVEKTTAGQFQRWDLANESGLPVASGIYIAYIEMPDLGVTKIVKFAIIQERQFLDRF